MRLVTVSPPRFVSPASSKHNGPGPDGRGPVPFRCQLQQLNEAIDLVINCCVLVLDKYFEFDAYGLQAQQSQTLKRVIT